MMTKQILVIEDDPDIGDMLTINLKDEGFVVEVCPEGIKGFELAKSQRYDLLVLDLMLPGMDGLEICRKLRSLPYYQPIIIISAKSAETQKVLGLELGADDYLAKPFSVLELVARIRALFRRIEAIQSNAHSKPDGIISGKLTIDLAGHEVKLEGKPVGLTMKEFELLLFFAQHPGKTFTRLELLDQVWGHAHDGYEHTVNSHINRLRAKIERDPAQPEFIQTVWGVGYKFANSGDGF